MGKIKYSIVGLLIPLLGACFSDDGNYNYESLKPPTWLRDVVARPIQIVVREGGKVRVDGSKYFNWGTMDSLQRSQEVRYDCSAKSSKLKFPTRSLCAKWAKKRFQHTIKAVISLSSRSLRVCRSKVKSPSSSIPESAKPTSSSTPRSPLLRPISVRFPFYS